MSKKNNTTRRAPKPKATITRKDALRLFSLINDERLPAEARRQIGEYTDDVCTDSPLMDTWANQKLFVASLLDGWGRDAYDTRKVEEILDRLDKGESPEAITQDFSRRLKESVARREAEERAQPEPTDKTSDAWRYWKLRRMERAFRGEDGATAQREVLREFTRLAKRAIRYAVVNTYHAEKMLPDLIIACQDAEKGGAL
jgi:hypothetical protein